MDAEEYCREVEAHLCRKNDGHLIRIVGPAFELGRRWAEQGIPLKVVLRGVDRYFERYYAKGPRRRPVRIDFCEADVLDVFDEWRRAVGVSASGLAAGAEEGKERPHGSLPAHLERVIARLTAMRGGAIPADLSLLLDRAVRELDQVRAGARALRGEARAEVLERLNALDAELIAAVRAIMLPQALQQLAMEAETELAPFRERMAPAAFDRARDACIGRLLRERHGLPTIAYEQ